MPRVVSHIADQHRLATRRGDSGDAFAQCDRKITNHLFAMPHGVADAQILPPLAIEQNRKHIVRQHLLDDLRHVSEQLVQVQRQGDGGRDLEQEIEQLGSLLETDRGLAGGLHHLRAGLNRRLERP